LKEKNCASRVCTAWGVQNPLAQLFPFDIKALSRGVQGVQAFWRVRSPRSYKEEEEEYPIDGRPVGNGV
jgi:hypothetical protein